MVPGADGVANATVAAAVVVVGGVMMCYYYCYCSCVARHSSVANCANLATNHANPVNPVRLLKHWAYHDVFQWPQRQVL